MLQNKIYQNFSIEIIKTFMLILFGLSMIALTVRAVGFLELMVDSGYPVDIYFKYSLLNLFGVATKFIPFSFFLALTIFIIKHSNNSEFSILWTSGVKKIKIVNLFVLIATLIMLLNLIFSVFFTPFALNKSRQLLSSDKFNSFLPTIKEQQFSDTFKGFTLIVEKKIENEIKNIFLYDKNNILKNLSSNVSNTKDTTIIAKKGIVDTKKLILIEGVIISSKKQGEKNEIIKFDQLNINLNELSTSTIKKPKLQELTTFKLLNCFQKEFNSDFCNTNSIKEIVPSLNRRIILPTYIPIIALICSLMLISAKRGRFVQILIYSMNFTLILFTELALRYTGLNNIVLAFYIGLPIILIIFFYFYLIYKFSVEFKHI
tara:strand:- start:21521 stop:22642 length:1122 start_codon:yes stop_codon:yes gene_type:complete